MIAARRRAGTIDRRALSRGFDGSPPPLFGLGSHFHVQAQLGLKIGVTPARTERAHKREPLAKAGHWLSGSLFLARKRRVQDAVTQSLLPGALLDTPMKYHWLR